MGAMSGRAKAGRDVRSEASTPLETCAPSAADGGVRRGRRGERGAELVEFALVLPILMLVLAGMVDMGFLFKNYEVVTNAAREGARMAALPGWTETDVKQRVSAYLRAGGLNGAAGATTISQVVLVTDAATGRSINGIKVVVTYPHTFMILGPISQLVQGAAVTNDINLTAVATMRTEAAAGL
jgi:Flp pilus assembly protein TadG